MMKINISGAQDIFHQVPFYQKSVKKTLTTTKLTEILQNSVSMVTGGKCALRRREGGNKKTTGDKLKLTEFLQNSVSMVTGEECASRRQEVENKKTLRNKVHS
jgi:hypothetical protein